MRIIKQDLEVYIRHHKYWYIDWHKNEICHREDGPSTIWNDGNEYYYVNGQYYFKNKDKYWKKVHENY